MNEKFPQSDTDQVEPHCWRERAWVCDHFEDNDQGICLNCGHYERCHRNE